MELHLVSHLHLSLTSIKTFDGNKFAIFLILPSPVLATFSPDRSLLLVSMLFLGFCSLIPPTGAIFATDYRFIQKDVLYFYCCLVAVVMVVGVARAVCGVAMAYVRAFGK